MADFNFTLHSAMQPCDCQTRPAFFEIHPDLVTAFLSGFDRLTTERSAIYHLYRCPACTMLWLVDDMTRGPMAVRVPSEAAAIGFDERPYRRQLLTEMHGGTSRQKCAFADCRNHALRGIVFCVDHQYPEYAGENRAGN